MEYLYPALKALALVPLTLLAFVLVCVGVEFMWTGWADLNHLPVP
jgi:hypothetical protein